MKDKIYYFYTSRGNDRFFHKAKSNNITQAKKEATRHYKKLVDIVIKASTDYNCVPALLEDYDVKINGKWRTKNENI